MVVLTPILGYASQARKFLRTGFIDKLRMHVKAGTGGSGIPRYGGIGGRGGHIYFEAKEGIDLKKLASALKHKRLVAGMGTNSQRKGIIGEAGEDLNICVPPGVIVYDVDQKVKIGELDEEGSRLMVAEGGMGGCPNNQFGGQKGQNRLLHLDLKLISDVALVGFPNAGKSTLIRTVSNAKPKIAEYPFTTVRPHLGKIQFKDDREITIADLPGLIEGAHANIGMGHDFLKHLERTKLLLFIVDIQGFQLAVNRLKRNCLETVLLLNREIELYKPELLDMPAMLVINKMDSEGAETIAKEIIPKLERLEMFTSEFPEDLRPEKALIFEDIMTTSLISKNKYEMTMLKDRIRTIIDKVTNYEDNEENESAENMLVKKLRRMTREEAPTLV